MVLMGGGPLTMEEWRYEASAILLAFYPGMEGGRALARVLFGEVNPSGKLPFTVPGDPRLPPFDPKAERVEYGYYHGYALAEKKGIELAFPFGFGLSYTRFVYGPAAPRRRRDERGRERGGRGRRLEHGRRGRERRSFSSMPASRARRSTGR